MKQKVITDSEKFNKVEVKIIIESKAELFKVLNDMAKCDYLENTYENLRHIYETLN